MSEQMKDYLEEYYNEYLTIEIEKEDIRKYKVTIFPINLRELKERGVEFYFKYENNFTFSSNMEYLKNRIDKAIINYYRREV